MGGAGMGLEAVLGMGTRPVSTPMREQRIVGPAGEEEIHHTVWCTIQGRSVSVGACRPCSRRERVLVDPTGRHSEVVCGMPPRHETAEHGGDALRMQACVSEVMTRRVICVRTTLPVRAVLMVLVEHGISGAPVVDAAGRPVGMVSITDLLREEYDQIEDEEDELLPHFAREAVDRNRAGGRPGGPAHLTAEDIMTPSVFSVREEARVADAAVEMARRGVHRVPVVSRDGAVVGMVSALDVMRWMAAGLSRQGPAEETP
jgi:CBS domain-containing protein